MATTRDRIKELGIELPAASTPAGNYIPAYRVGNLVYMSGVGPRKADGTLLLGKLGDDCTIEQGYEAARLCGLQILVNLEREIGDLDKVVHFVKLLGMINATPDFVATPKVMNGCSDVLVEVLGDRGRHARCAVGMATLPNGMAVEVESLIQVAN
jgi:enamine deaminase RidA (YjgF/YER057c/UK114 family)